MTGTNGVAIGVSNLSKMFKMYAKPADMFWELLTGKEKHRPFWALRDVNFDVHRGQVVGIMGRNGAGKSTLLKIITGTLDLTSGSVSVAGRVSSILELGTGFNSEYSGRENIYLGGLMVGLSREEILSKMDWIIQFSELEDFIDQPFKTYSTGMQARLTFSTAVCVDPDILIIDEALSVGDARFQQKSFGKIQEFQKSGRTILLVSHDPNTISTFCDHAILLENGKVFDQGEPQRISKVYYKMLFSSDSASDKSLAAPTEEEPASAESEITLDCSEIVPERGYAWRIDLATYAVRGDSNESPSRSRFVLYEDDKPLRPGHYSHDLIRQYGKGGYSHWGSSLYFSTSDNSDPRTNGRKYALVHEALIGRRTEAKSLASPDQERLVLRRAALQKLGLTEPTSGNTSRQTGMGNKKAEVLEFGILDESGNRVNRLTSGRRYTFYFSAILYTNLKEVAVGFLIRDIKGVDLFGINNMKKQIQIPYTSRGDLIHACMDATMWLTNGTYFLSLGIADPLADSNPYYDFRYDALQFAVETKKGILAGSVVDLDAEMQIDGLNLV